MFSRIWQLLKCNVGWHRWFYGKDEFSDARSQIEAALAAQEMGTEGTTASLTEAV